MRKGRKGFTLIELLVGMGVFSILILVLFTLVQGTLTINQTTRTQGELLEELKDATGYLADSLQEAQVLLSSATVNRVTCALPDCLVTLASEESGSSCALRAYRLVPRAQAPDDFKDSDPWADANTRTLLEYRLSGQSCRATTFSSAQPFLVLDRLDNQNLSLFTLSSSNVTLNLRLKAKDRERIFYVPGPNQAYTIRVYPRNAP